MKHYYVYIIRDCDTNDISYVGKGKLERAYRQIFNINGKERMCKFYENGGEPLSLLEFYASRLSEKDALHRERILINELKDNGIKLLNKIIFSPHHKTEEWKEKIRASNIGKHNHFKSKNPNAKKCIMTQTGKLYDTLLELCEDNNFNYKSVRSSLHSARKGKPSKYEPLIKFI